MAVVPDREDKREAPGVAPPERTWKKRIVEREHARAVRGRAHGAGTRTV